MIPAGAITAVDLDKKTVEVALTNDQIKDAPDYEATRRDEATYRQELGDYYGGF